MLPKKDPTSKSYTARPFVRSSVDLLYVSLPDEDRVIMVNPADAQVQADIFTVKSGTGDSPARPDWLDVESQAPDGILVLNNVGQTLSFIDLAQKTVTDNLIQLGLYPNMLRVAGTAGYVVLSGDHALAQFVANKPEQSTYIAAYLTFPDGSNPFDLGISSDGTLGFVSDQALHRVYAVKLGVSPELLATIE